MATSSQPLIIVIESNVRGRKSEVLNSLCQMPLIPEAAGCFEQPFDTYTNIENHNLLLEYFNRELTFTEFQNAIMSALAHRDSCAIDEAKRAGRSIVVLERSFVSSMSFVLAEYKRYGITQNQLEYLSMMADLVCGQYHGCATKDAQLIYLDSMVDYDQIRQEIQADERDGEKRWVESKDRRWFELLQRSQYQVFEEMFGDENVHYVNAERGEISTLSLAQTVGALITNLAEEKGLGGELKPAKLILPSLNAVDVNIRRFVSSYFTAKKTAKTLDLGSTTPIDVDQDFDVERGPPPIIRPQDFGEKNEEEEKMELLRMRMELLDDIREKLVFVDE